MPRNQVQGFVFGLLMSYVMAYGMEVYNVAIKEGCRSICFLRTCLCRSSPWHSLLLEMHMSNSAFDVIKSQV